MKNLFIILVFIIIGCNESITPIPHPEVKKSILNKELANSSCYYIPFVNTKSKLQKRYFFASFVAKNKSDQYTGNLLFFSNTFPSNTTLKVVINNNNNGKLTDIVITTIFEFKDSTDFFNFIKD